jgi:hypothetical protein
MPFRSVFQVCLLFPLSLLLAQNSADQEVMIYENPGNGWFEGPMTRAVISPDATWALFTAFGNIVRVVSLKTGKEDLVSVSSGLDSPAEAAAFCGNGTLAVKGKRGSDHGWFISRAGTLQLTSVPAAAVVRCSPDATRLAYYVPFATDSAIFVGPDRKYEKYSVTGRLTGAAFAPDGRVLYAVVFGDGGESSLIRITPGNSHIETVVGGLDAPDNAAGHQPNAPRWLKIYEIDLSAGIRSLVLCFTNTMAYRRLRQQGPEGPP